MPISYSRSYDPADWVIPLLSRDVILEHLLVKPAYGGAAPFGPPEREPPPPVLGVANAAANARLAGAAAVWDEKTPGEARLRLVPHLGEDPLAPARIRPPHR